MDVGTIGGVVLSAATGGIGGALLRMLPVGLEWWNKKRELDHEFRMAQLDVDKQKYFAEHQLKLEDKATERIETEKSLDAYITALQAQSTPAPTITYTPIGNKWVDGLMLPVVMLTNFMTSLVYVLSASVRPLVTYAFVWLYLWVKYATYQSILVAERATWYTATLKIWTPDDMTLLSGTISFWFVGRIFDKESRK